MQDSLSSFEYQTGFQVLSEIHNENENKMQDKNAFKQATRFQSELIVEFQIAVYLNIVATLRIKPNYFLFYQTTFCPNFEPCR